MAKETEKEATPTVSHARAPKPRRGVGIQTTKQATIRMAAPTVAKNRDT